MRRQLAMMGAAAAALVLTGCGGGGDPAAPATVTVTATAHTSPRWVDVTRHGGPYKPDATGADYGEHPWPGKKILHEEGGQRYRCTVGPIIHNHTRTALLTSPHCGIGDEQFMQADAAGNDLRPIGTAVGSERYGPAAAVVWTGDYYPASKGPTIGGLPIDGVMSVDEIEALPQYTPICALGAVSGLRCGPLGFAVAGSVTFGDVGGGVTTDGDSGGAVFVVDGETERATLIGLVTSTGDITSAEYLQPILDTLGAEVTTHPK